MIENREGKQDGGSERRGVERGWGKWRRGRVLLVLPSSVTACNRMPCDGTGTQLQQTERFQVDLDPVNGGHVRRRPAKTVREHMLQFGVV